MPWLTDLMRVWSRKILNSTAVVEVLFQVRSTRSSRVPSLACTSKGGSTMAR